MQEALGQEKEDTIIETSQDLRDVVHPSHEVNVGMENEPIVIDQTSPNPPVWACVDNPSQDEENNIETEIVQGSIIHDAGKEIKISEECRKH